MARKKASEADLIRELDNIKLEYDMAKKLNKLSKVNENISINRYDNGWMVEVGGRDDENDWKTVKTICNTEDEVIALIKEWNTKDLDN